MRFRTVTLFSALVLAVGVAAAQKAPLKDLPGYKDPALFTLTPHGDGPFAPVAANTTEEGRPKNRRVELVVQP
jgi:hypothetical protein